MLRRLSLLFVGVLAAVGVSAPALASASPARVSKEWPRVGVLLTAAVTVLLAWILLFGTLSGEVLATYIIR
jgi:hypothetical protein